MQGSVSGSTTNGLLVIVEDRASFDKAMRKANVVLPGFVEVQVGEWRLETLARDEKQESK